MGDRDKSLIDKAKDALGMGDDNRDEQRDRGTASADANRDASWNSDAGAGGATGATGAGTADTAGGTGGPAARDQYGNTRGEAASGESALGDDEGTDTGRRESGM